METKEITNSIKQILVIRKDLKMRRGKECSQASHASMSWLSKRLQHGNSNTFTGALTEPEKEWLMGLFTKVTLQVNSEQELLSVYEAAKTTNLEVHLITDAGLTEFNGVPTVTCLAIGPDYSDKIDAITKNLKLY